MRRCAFLAASMCLGNLLVTELGINDFKEQLIHQTQPATIRGRLFPVFSYLFFIGAVNGSGRLSSNATKSWQTIQNRYPLPLLEGMFDSMGGAKVFNKIDLKLGH